MFAQTQFRPEIARVAEETVLNLKQLESRIDVLKNDLAALCTVLGHPEAARIAVTPPAWLGINPQLPYGNFGQGGLGTFGSQGPFGLGNTGSFPGAGATPFPSQVPWGTHSPWTTGVVPGMVPGMTPGVPQFGAPFVGSPYGISPFPQGLGVGGSAPYGNVPYGNLASPVYPPIR